MNNKMLERWKLKTKGIFHKITYDEFWFYIDDLMKENKKITNNWNELEEHLIHEIEEWEHEEDEWIKAQVYEDKAILHKMKEISGEK